MVTRTPNTSNRPLLAHNNSPFRLPATCQTSVLMKSTINTMSRSGSAFVATTYRSLALRTVCRTAQAIMASTANRVNR